MNKLKTTLAIAIAGLSLSAISVEARPPAQVPRGAQAKPARDTQTKAESTQQNARMKTVAVSVEKSKEVKRGVQVGPHGYGGTSINR